MNPQTGGMPSQAVFTAELASEAYYDICSDPSILSHVMSHFSSRYRPDENILTAIWNTVKHSATTTSQIKHLTSVASSLPFSRDSNLRLKLTMLCKGKYVRYCDLLSVFIASRLLEGGRDRLACLLKERRGKDSKGVPRGLDRRVAYHRNTNDEN